MARYFRLIFLLLSASPLVAPAEGTSENIKFKHLSVDDGLSQSTVFAITQDANSNLWLGTMDGLNRYDGYGFTAFRHTVGDSTSIANSNISSLLTDSEGTVWIGTTTGLSKYSYAEGRFHNYYLPGRNVHIYDIVETEDPLQLLMATDLGVVLFDKRTERLDLKSYLEGITAQCLCSFRDGILIGTSKGIYNYSIRYGTIVKVMPELGHLDVVSIVAETDGLWIGTHGNGLYKTDGEFQITGHYSTRNPNAKGFASDYVRVVKSDGAGKLWIGTFEGLVIYDQATGRFTPYLFEHNDETSINHNSIRSIYKDNQGGMWLGTYYGGVSYYHPLAFRFDLIRHRPAHNSLADNTVSCITEEVPTGNLWIGTNDMGLNYYEVKSGRFTLYQAADGGRGTLGSNNVKCVVQDEQGAVWVGTHAGGLSRLDPKSGRIETYHVTADIPIRNSCYSLYRSAPSSFWVGTLDGLLSFDLRTRQFSPHRLSGRDPWLDHTVVNTIREDSRSNVWLGTGNGLFRWESATDRLTGFGDMLADDGSRAQQAHVLCLREDSHRMIWIGTRQGLFRYDYNKGEFRHYTTADGLPNDMVYGILEDDLGRLWLSTNKGLSCLDPASGTFRNYTKADGISSNQFNQFSYCQAKNGVFYFGSINGITSFRPHNLTDNPFSPPPAITGVTIFNREILPDGKRARLVRDARGALIGATLRADRNLFTVHFVVVNMLAGNRNEFSYMLEGFDNGWYTTRNREATYSNLSPGSYQFRVKSCNNDGNWSPEETVFTIRILPMWYQTMLARVLYVLLAAGIAVMLIRFYAGKAKMRVQLYFERVQARKKEEMSQEKIRFYVNMSHELRTPLTLILSPLEEIRSHGLQDKYVEKRIDYIYRNSSKLLHIVNQLLDYRKAELGMFKLGVAMTDVEVLVANIFALFEDSAQNRDMDYILSSNLHNEPYPVDSAYIEMIVTNLLSNAFKFTRDGGTIKVSLDREADRLVLRVRDSGIGIAKDKQKSIFERFYQVNESHPGTGIGLSIVKRLAELHHAEVSLESEPGQFTEFTVSFPAGASAYTPEEMASEPPKAQAARDMSLFIQDDSFSDRDRAAGQAGPEQETLLIVEDNPQIKEYLAENFRGRFRVITASDGEEALALLRSEEPDLIISDIMMEGMDGMKLTRHIKQNIRTSHIPVILLTAKDTPEDQMAGIEAGADDYLAKPFSVSILNAKVNNFIKARHRFRHYYSNSTEIDPDKITSNSVDGDFLKKAIRIVEENIGNEEFSSNDFARELCMSRSNLHLKIKSITGESSTKFIRKIRFNYACQLLREGKHSISEISTMVGFNSPSYFATSFKKHMGCLPTEYVKNRQASRQAPGEGGGPEE